MITVAYNHILVVMLADIVYILKTLADENRIRILNLFLFFRATLLKITFINFNQRF